MSYTSCSFPAVTVGDNDRMTAEPHEGQGGRLPVQSHIDPGRACYDMTTGGAGCISDVPTTRKWIRDKSILTAFIAHFLSV